MIVEPQSEKTSKQKPVRLVRSYPVSPSFWKFVKFAAICLLTLGVLFRFANLDLKPYWLDEAFTSLRLTGYTNAEVIQQLENRILTIKDIKKYQQPNSDRSSLDVIKQLAIQEPQLTPLYFVMLRAWVKSVDTSIAAIRSLSAIFSLLAFPCLYWLCLELFKSRRIAWVAIAIIAVSPIHLIYAQEARPLSLWILTTLISCATLLRAMRERTKMNWIIYAVSISVGLYSHLFTALLSISHGVYVVLYERFRLSKTSRAFFLASIAAWLTFVPWIVFGLLANRHTMDGQSQAMPLKDLVKGWIRGISLIFVDFSLNEDSPRLYFLMFLGLVCAVLLFVGGILLCFCRSASREVRLFILPMIAVPFLTLITSDFATDASRSSVARYLLSAYLGIQLAVAYVLATRMGRMVASVRYQKVWMALTGLVLAIGIASGGLMVTSEFWWHKADANVERQLAQVVNRSKKPIVIADDFFVKFLSFTHSLSPDIHFQLLSSSSVPTIPQGFSDVFLYRPSERLQTALGAKYDLQPIQAKQLLLWRLKQKTIS